MSVITTIHFNYNGGGKLKPKNKAIGYKPVSSERIVLFLFQRIILNITLHLR